MAAASNKLLASPANKLAGRCTTLSEYSGNRNNVFLSRRSMLHSPVSTLVDKKTSSKNVCMALTTCRELQAKERRSANYHPTIWGPALIDSFTTPYSYESHGSRLEHLKEETKRLLMVSTQDPLAKLKFIDSMQRLGVAYHFEEEIKEILALIKVDDFSSDHHLHATALHFRLLREHAFTVNTDAFGKFRSKDGKFKDSLRKDVAGLLSLYEASYLGVHGEDVLEEANSFSSKHLKAFLGQRLEGGNGILIEEMQQSMEVPLHWRMPRLEARNFIDLHTKHGSSSSILLELAKLDYNVLQSLYQQELKDLSRWWRDLGFNEKLSFSRDRLMENYLWILGGVYEPQYSKCRVELTKFVCILTAIDDMYDVYGSLDELELFTDAVNRWDIQAMDGLPEYMRICYLAMFNFVNQIAYDVMKEHGLISTQSYLVEEWKRLCGAYMVEARWFARKYTPTLEEYLGNAWTSVGLPACMGHAAVLQGRPIAKSSQGSEDLLYWSSLITRLSDDLGTYKAESMRGDVAKAVECYMNEASGVSEEEARIHVKDLIGYSWKKLNEESVKSSSLPRSLGTLSLNIARTAQCIFQYGDGIGTSFGSTKDRLRSLIVRPIAIK